MVNLVIDIGNSYSKVAVFNYRELIHFERIAQLDTHVLHRIIGQFSVQNATLSSVGASEADLVAYLANTLHYVPFTTAVQKNVINQYQTPHTLGLDRWAKVLGGRSIFPQSDCLLIDVGTCLTYDFVSADGIYRGGSISPGIAMRFKALHQYTKRLPLLDFDREIVEIPQGNSTPNAMVSGVLNGVVNEVGGYLGQLQQQKSSAKAILTGGDADFLSKQLKNSIFAPLIGVDPYLVLRGLNEVILA